MSNKKDNMKVDVSEAPDDATEAQKKQEPVKVKAPFIIGTVAMCTRRGVIGPGQPISAADFKGGQDTFDQNVKNGKILKNK